MSMFQETDWEGIKKDITSPIESAIVYLKQGDKESAVKNIRYAQTKLPGYAGQLDRGIFEELNLKIKKAESLVPINPNDIDSVIKLVSVRETLDSTKKSFQENAAKTFNVFEERMRKLNVQDKTISDALTNYKSKIEVAISSEIPEINKSLKNMAIR